MLICCAAASDAAFAIFFCRTHSAVIYSGSEGIGLAVVSWADFCIFDVIFRYSGDNVVLEVDACGEEIFGPLEMPENDNSH